MGSDDEIDAETLASGLDDILPEEDADPADSVRLKSIARDVGIRPEQI